MWPLAADSKALCLLKTWRDLRHVGDNIKACIGGNRVRRVYRLFSLMEARDSLCTT